MNSTRTRLFLLILLPLLLLLAGVYAASAGSPTPPVADDPLVRMPGTQPGEVLIEAPPYCLVCHSEYDQDVEPGFNWMGSMMAQSARDFVFFAAMAVAGQDSVWAIDSPNAMDICERCHFPKGWLEGRSDPPNASAMLAADYDGVQCDVCHRMIDPFFELTYQGTRESSDWIDYWDEAGNTGPGSGTLAQTAADATHTQDALLLQAIEFFNGNPFYGPDNLPVSPGYTENGSGQYYVSPNTDKRGPFADANSPHQILYSRYHKSKFFCSSCHDVSNPVLANIDFAGTPPGDGSTVLPTEEDSAYAYFHVERTFSEFMLSDYGQPGGAEGIGPFASDVFTTSHTTDVIATCQDCHLRDVAGQAAFQGSAVYRTGDPATTESTEHPYSGQPLHDMTGGNAWVGTVLASAAVGSPNYDPVNDALLNQGPAVLTLDLGQGETYQPLPILAGAQRALAELALAATVDDLIYDPAAGAVSFRIQNQTGHKLITGFLEGRRMFANIQAFDAGHNLIYEVNPYDNTVGTLKGLPNSLSSPPLGPNEAYVDELVYEAHPQSSLTGEDETFHFVLADDRYKDNRIPPKGFDIDAAADRLAEPRWQGQPAPAYFTSAEYAGGYDYVAVSLPPGAASVEVRLYYQTTSREYMEFLRDEINGTDNLTLPDPDPGTPGNQAYIIQTDPFFSQLKAWGDTLWQLWEHNKDLPGAAPVLMTEATVVPSLICHASDIEPNADHSNPGACDGDVDVADVQREAGCWNQPAGTVACPAGLDMDGDDFIGVLDVVTVATAWPWPG